MSELKSIENKFTLPLDLVKPRLDMRKGWSETIARKLGDVTRLLEHPRPTRSTTAERWQEWFEDKQRVVYTLGRRASLLAVASFHEATLVANGVVASHKMEFQSYQDTELDFLAAFLQAAHHDLDSAQTTWLELDTNDATPTHLYSSVGYTRVSPRENNRMIREIK